MVSSNILEDKAIIVVTHFYHRHCRESLPIHITLDAQGDSHGNGESLFAGFFLMSRYSDALLLYIATVPASLLLLVRLRAIPSHSHCSYWPQFWQLESHDAHTCVLPGGAKGQ